MYRPCKKACSAEAKPYWNHSNLSIIFFVFFSDIFRGTKLFNRELNIKSRNKDVNNKDNSKPHGLQSLAHGYNRNHSQHQQQHLLPTMPPMHNMMNPFANADPAALLQALGCGNPYANLANIGVMPNQNIDRDSFKDSRRRNDNHSSRPYDRDRDRNRGRDRSRDRSGRDRRTDKWKNNRR